MNKERLLRIADLIEEDHHKFNGIVAMFNMSTWLDYYRQEGHVCNTTACVAGFAVLEFDYENASKLWEAGKRFDEHNICESVSYDVEDEAAKLLGFEYDNDELADLFHGPSTASPAHAAKVIRNFVETGEVDWYPDE